MDVMNSIQYKLFKEYFLLATTWALAPTGSTRNFWDLEPRSRRAGCRGLRNQLFASTIRRGSGLSYKLLGFWAPSANHHRRTNNSLMNCIQVVGRAATRLGLPIWIVQCTLMFGPLGLLSALVALPNQPHALLHNANPNFVVSVCNTPTTGVSAHYPPL